MSVLKKLAGIAANVATNNDLKTKGASVRVLLTLTPLFLLILLCTVSYAERACEKFSVNS